MDEPPGSEPAFQEGIKHLYDESKHSDVTITFPGGGDRQWHVVFAHKVILAAGSSAFDHHFGSNPPNVNGTDYEIQISDIYDDEKDDGGDNSEVVLRHIYGMPPALEDAGRVLGAQPCDWRGIYDAAIGFGVPSLRQHIIDRLAPHLSQLLSNAEAGNETCLEQFVEEVRYIHVIAAEEAMYHDMDDAMQNGQMETIRDAAIELCCQHYNALRYNDSFIKMSTGNPEVLRAMMDHSARQASDTSG